MPKKSSAYYQRQYRERLRAQGLVKKEVWILPDFAKTLSNIENLLRESATASELSSAILQSKSILTNNNPSSSISTIKAKKWTTSNLFDEMLELSDLSHVTFDLLQEADESAIIHITMSDYGDLPLFMTVQGEQIIVETILCLADEISNVDDFNKIVLKTHKYFPLSTISLDTLVMEDGNNCDVYQMFGSLHATSSIDDIMLEIYMLTKNVMQALEAYGDCFKGSH